MNPEQALETDSGVWYGVLYPPLRGIVQLTNSDTLRFRNWSFTIKGAHLDYFGLTGDYNKDAPKFFYNGASLQFMCRGWSACPAGNPGECLGITLRSLVPER
jgi:hypothetical protein